MDQIRRRLTYANVVATLALFVALGGGAYAVAKLNGKKIEKRSIPGNRLKADSVRSNEVADLATSDFRPGQLPGPFDPTAPLTSGKTISGVFAAGNGNLGNLLIGITFSPPLAADLPQASTQRLNPGATSAQCPAPGQAANGVLCVYETSKLSAIPNVIGNPVTGGEGASRFGADIEYSSTAANAYVYGSWSVTAP